MSRSVTVTDRIDAICELLGDSRRRHLLDYLVGTDGEVFELADAVIAVREREMAETKTETESEMETSDQPSREEVRTTLHHSHLPRLADAEVLDYDTRHGTIRFPGHGEVEEWLEHARSRELE